MAEFSRLERHIVKTPRRPKDLARIGQETRTRFFGFFAWARLAMVPLIVSVAAWIALSDSALWRQLSMGTVITLLITVSIIDVGQVYLRGEAGPLAIPRNVLGAGLATLVLISSTGGLESPFMPVIVVVALFTTIFISPTLGRLIVLGFQLPTVWACAMIAVWELVPSFIPDVFGSGARAGWGDTLIWTAAVLYTTVLMAIISFGAHIRISFEAMLARVFEERDKQLRIYGEQAKTLTTLSGEIAHELKNPLASIKGLAALIARSLEDKPAERMKVLRKEVDRMQAILQEFLNFSRPLVPLSLERADLAELVHEVVDLHEGLCREQEIQVRVQADEAVELDCDPRKLKQVLINLLQNAFEASPNGAAVEVEVMDDGEQRRVRVNDEGPGLDLEVSDRIFEPGVTSKATGSGLGLTVAQALARQHGGEISLTNHPSGGAVATLTLPSRPPLDSDPEQGEPQR